MVFDMQFAIVDAGLNLVDDLLLQEIHARNECFETSIAEGIGTGNVGRIAVDLCAGINKKGTQGRRGSTLQLGVVQHGTVLV